MPKIVNRKVNKRVLEILVDSGLDPVLAKVVAARPHPKLGPLAALNPKLNMLDHPTLMKGMGKAVKRLVRAIKNQEIIAIETDHDCDGQTSHAVIYLALTDIFNVSPDLIQSFIGHRMKEGYGLSESVMNRILGQKNRPSLVITADNGSADEPRICQLKQENIDVIVTDHHHLPDAGPPQSAYVTLNPTQHDCQFPDAMIAGCMVAWLFMAATRAELLKQGLLDDTAVPIATLLDFVAVGTVADCVSMASSINNRAVVRYGLKKIMQMQRPCWQALIPILNKSHLRAEDLGFTIGPMLNSDGRLSDAFGSVSFLLANNLAEAQEWARLLAEQNEARKDIQKRITDDAMKLAALQVSAGKVSIGVYLPDGHAGVHGISASRLKDAFGRPVIIFSPKEGDRDLISGSARSIDGLNIRDAIARANDIESDSVQKFGGHTGAAGLSILKSDLDRFLVGFEQAVREQIAVEDVGPVILTDGPLPETHLSLDFVSQILTLDPFGREFESPIFEAEATLTFLKPIGKNEQHLSMQLTFGHGAVHRGIWFSADSKAFHLLPGTSVRAVFSLSDNEFRGQHTLQLMVKDLQSI